ncbi:MAG: carbohydrate ABC transporter substrate-binding protein [Candidatus Competibacteraceae bacterium]|nr:carbohydrate ABC transporter substrate-binding protein [Candidatus Competibacteraceae bacterium]
MQSSLRLIGRGRRLPHVGFPRLDVCAILVVAMLGCAAWSATISAGSAAPPSKPEIDLAHYWISPGERASLDVIKAAFIAAGGVWHESPSLDYERMRRDVVTRLAVGLPPSAMWWGAEDRSISKVLDFLRPIHELAPDDWSRRLNAAARSVIGNPQQTLQLPITIHNENWAWYNGQRYRQLELSLPRNWSEFLSQAPIFTAHGIIPLAVADQPFSVGKLFNMVVLGVAGREGYTRLFMKADATVFDDPAMQQALRVFLELRRWSSKPNAAKTWDAATRLVSTGRAAMQVMGDWARAEFAAVGVSDQNDIICAPPPGSAGTFIVAVDMFAFLKKEADAYEGQRLLTQVMLRPDIQIQFANHKGSTPVLKNFDVTALHECSKLTLPLLLGDHDWLPSVRTTLPEEPRTRIVSVTYRHWRSGNSTLGEFTADLKAALQPRLE